MSLLLDTGFLYALLNRTEQNHERALAVALTVCRPLKRAQGILLERDPRAHARGYYSAAIYDGWLRGFF